MKNFLRLISAAVILTLSSNVLAYENDRENFTYDGSSSRETVTLVSSQTETRYRTEMVNARCTRQVPVTEQICNNETRYRQECYNNPSRRECRTEYQRECRNVTDYREECFNRPSQTECRMENGRRICRNVGGGRECRRVPYTRQECRDFPREYCRDIPGERICRDVPYTERVCRNETRYRTEEYTCQREERVPYTVVRRFINEVEFNFRDVGVRTIMDFEVSQTQFGELTVRAFDRSDMPKVAVAKISRSTLESSEQSTRVRSIYDVRFMPRSAVDGGSTIQGEITKLNFDSSKVVIVFSNTIQRTDSLKVKLLIKDLDENNELINRVIDSFDLQFAQNENGQTKMKINLDNIDLDFSRGHTYRVEVRVRTNGGNGGTQNVDGVILNDGIGNGNSGSSELFKSITQVL